MQVWLLLALVCFNSSVPSRLFLLFNLGSPTSVALLLSATLVRFVFLVWQGCSFFLFLLRAGCGDAHWAIISANAIPVVMYKIFIIKMIAEVSVYSCILLHLELTTVDTLIYLMVRILITKACFMLLEVMKRVILVCHGIRLVIEKNR